jgi:putative DNA primase/helicase
MLQAFDLRTSNERQEKSRQAAIKFAIGSGNTGKISGMLSQAEPHLAAQADTLDADPWALNCQNGTLDLRTLQLRPHTQADLLTKLAPIAYDPTAACPIWEKFLLEIFSGDEEMVGFLQRALGYSLTGITTEQIVFILHGSGSNGKSVLLETIAAVLSDYAQQCPSDTFVSHDKGSHIPNDIARLVGARFVSIVETEQDRKLAEGLVKQATGGDRMVARFLHKEWFEFTPKFKLWMATNHKPRVRGSDNAIWRRLRLLPFLVTFADPEEAQDGQPVKDRDLKSKLMNELQGILRWMVEGCTKWQADGLLKAPTAVLEATTEYRESQDIASAFLGDCFHFSPGIQCAVADIYKTYKKWCADNGESPASSMALSGALEEKGFVARKGTGGRRMRKGLDLKLEWQVSDIYDNANRVASGE